MFYQPLGENRISNKNHEFVTTPDIETSFTNSKLTTEPLDVIEKENMFDTLEKIQFYDNIPKKGTKCATTKDALYILPKTIAKIRNLPLPTYEIIKNSSDLQAEGTEKTIIPSYIKDIYTRPELILGLKKLDILIL